MDTLLFVAWVAGCIGNLAFGVCYLPQVIKTYKHKTADGISTMLIVLNLIGNLFGFIYLYSTDMLTGNWHIPIFANYVTAFVLNIVLFYMKVVYRKGTMRSVNIHVHQYPDEIPELTDGEYIHRTVTMITSIYSGNDTVVSGNGERIPVYKTDFHKEWGGHRVKWLYTDELIAKVMDGTRD